MPKFYSVCLLHSHLYYVDANIKCSPGYTTWTPSDISWRELLEMLLGLFQLNAAPKISWNSLPLQVFLFYNILFTFTSPLKKEC